MEINQGGCLRFCSSLRTDSSPSCAARRRSSHSSFCEFPVASWRAFCCSISDKRFSNSSLVTIKYIHKDAKTNGSVPRQIIVVLTSLPEGRPSCVYPPLLLPGPCVPFHAPFQISVLYFSPALISWPQYLTADLKEIHLCYTVKQVKESQTKQRKMMFTLYLALKRISFSFYFSFRSDTL